MKRYNQIKEGRLFKVAPSDITVYDNGGKSIDRYTVIMGNEAYGMSSDANAPNGFNQYIGVVGRDIKVGRHLGKIVKLEKLPQRVLNAIEDRMEEENYH